MVKLEAHLIFLLKIISFSWTQAVTKYFEKFKGAMCKNSILAVPNFTKSFIMERDASRHGIGAILMQEGRPLAFESFQIKG